MKRINKQIFYRVRADVIALTVLFSAVMRIGATTPVPTHENYGYHRGRHETLLDFI